MLDATTIAQLREKMSAKLTKQEATLQRTLDEIDHIQNLATTATPGSFDKLLANLRTKRDHQHNALLATQQAVSALAVTKKGK